MTSAIVKFYLQEDEKTYWTLMIQEETTASDVCKQISQKLSLSPATLTIVAHDDGFRDVLRGEDTLLPMKTAKFLVVQRRGVAKAILAREVVLVNEVSVSPNGALQASPPPRRRIGAHRNITFSESPMKAKTTAADYSFSSDEDEDDKTKITFSIAESVAPAPDAEATLILAPPPQATSRTRRGTASKKVEAVELVPARVAQHVENGQDDSDDPDVPNTAGQGGSYVFAITPPRQNDSVKLTRRRLLRDRRGPSKMALMSASASGPATPTRTPSGLPILSPRDFVDMRSADASEEEEEEDGSESDQPSLTRFASHPLPFRVVAEKAASLGGIHHHGRTPWILQCAVERLFCPEACVPFLFRDAVRTNCDAAVEALHHLSTLETYTEGLAKVSIDDAASVLVMYVAIVPNGLIPSNALAAFHMVAQDVDVGKRVARLARLVDALPDAHRTLLSDLIHLSVMVVSKCSASGVNVEAFAANNLVTLTGLDVVCLTTMLENPEETVGDAFYVPGDLYGKSRSLPRVERVFGADPLIDSVMIHWNPFVGQPLDIAKNPFDTNPTPRHPPRLFNPFDLEGHRQQG